MAEDRLLTWLRLRLDLTIAGLIFVVTLVVFLESPVRQVTDSSYSMLLSQSLLDYHTFALDHYALPRLEPKDRRYYTSDGDIYHIELANNRFFYHFPPGSSVLSVPFVAVLNVFGLSAANRDGTYNADGEGGIEARLAALLMAGLALLFFFSGRLMLSRGWSASVALGGALGTQVWSTASRAMWTDTWGILLLGIVTWMVLAHETGKHKLNPVLLASVLSSLYFVRPTYSVHILGITAYVLVFHRRLLIRYALTGFIWAVLFVVYSLHYFGHALPSYFRASRLTLVVFWISLAGNLVSPGRGLLIYVPALLFVAYLLLRYHRQIAFPRLVVLTLVIVVGHLLTVSCFGQWWAGHSFGARFNTGLVPWFVLLAILGIQAMLVWREKHPALTSIGRRLELAAGSSLLLLSIGINARGATSLYTWVWNVSPENIDQHPERNWDWRYPQFLAGLIYPPPPEDAPLPGPDRLDFSKPETERYLWYGWAGPEPRFRWTDGREAAMVFGLDEVRDLVLNFKCGAFLVPARHVRQRVAIGLNGSLLTRLEISDEAPREYTTVLPASLLRQRNTLVFSLPDAESPQKFGRNKDYRTLGIAVYWMQFRPKVEGR